MHPMLHSPLAEEFTELFGELSKRTGLHTDELYVWLMRLTTRLDVTEVTAFLNRAERKAAS